MKSTVSPDGAPAHRRAGLPLTFLLGLLANSLGSELWNFAFPLVVLSLKVGGVLTGFAFFADTMVGIVSSVLAGRILNLLGPLPTILLSALLSASVSIGIWLASDLSQYVQYGTLLLAASLLFSSSSLCAVTLVSVTPRLVATEELDRANSLIALTSSISVACGPVAGSFVFAALGGWNVALVDGASSLVLALSLIVLAAPIKQGKTSGSLKAEAASFSYRQGLRWLLDTHPMSLLLTFNVLANSSVIAFNIALLMGLDEQKGSVSSFGVVLAFVASGQLLGSFLALRMIRAFKRTETLVALFTFLFAASTALCALTTSFTVIAASAFSIMFLLSALSINNIGLRQRLLAKEAAGAAPVVNGLVRAISLLAVAPSAMVAGAIFDAYGPAGTYALAAALAWLSLVPALAFWSKA